MATTTNFSNLTGTERQVAWAGDIRNDMLPFFKTAVETAGLPAPAAEIANSVIANMEAETEAKYWINQRVEIDNDNEIHAAAQRAGQMPQFTTFTVLGRAFGKAFIDAYINSVEPGSEDFFRLNAQHSKAHNALRAAWEKARSAK